MALINCPECGKETSDRAERCPHCGYPLKHPSPQYNYQPQVQPYSHNPCDVPSTGLNILSFFIPLVGLVLYCANLSTAPQKANSIGKWALIGFITGLIITITCSCEALL